MVYNAAFMSDTWKATNRLTFNLGVRYEHYVDGCPGSVVHAQRHAGARQLAGDREPGGAHAVSSLIAPVTVAAREVARHAEHRAARRASRTT